MQADRVPSIVFSRTAPKSAHAREAPPTKADQITADLYQSLGIEAPKTPQPPPAAKPRRSLPGRILRGLGWLGAAVGVGAGVVGAIGYTANHEAFKTPSVSLYLDAELFQTPNLSPTTQASAPEQQQVGRKWNLADSPVTVFLPSDTVRQVVDDLAETAPIARLLEQKVAQVRQDVQQKLGQLAVPANDLLLDLEIPLPTGDRPFFHLGEQNLPSGGLRELRSETVPLSLHVSAEPITTGIDLQLEMMQGATAPEEGGPGMFLGTARARVTAGPDLVIRGTADLRHDLDGQVTRAKLDGLEPGPSALRSRLERRLYDARQLSQHQGVRDTLETALDSQSVEFEGHVRTGDKPLAEVLFHLWLSPDSDGDGRAEVKVTQQADLDQLEAMQIEVTRLENTGQAPEGRLARWLHSTAGDYFEDGVRAALPEATAALQKLTVDKVGEQLAGTTPEVALRANRVVDSAFQVGDRGLTIHSTHQGVSDLTFWLGQVQVGPDGNLAVAIKTRAGLGDVPDQQLPPGMALAAGEAGVKLDGTLLNTHLRDQSDGGSIDWKSFLEKVESGADLREVSFGCDAAGHPCWPRIILDQGKPAVVFDVNVIPNGAKPVEGVTGLVAGATGALDGGAAKLQKGLEEKTGLFGTIVGGIIRIPTAVIDGAAGVGKVVVDNTAGLVVDTTSEALTRPSIHTGVVVPLKLDFDKEGLNVIPLGDEVRFSNPEQKVPFDVTDLIPTRALANLIARTVASAAGPSQVGEQAEKVNLDVNLERLGAEIAELGWSGGKENPDLVVKLKVTPQAAEWIAARAVSGLER